MVRRLALSRPGTFMVLRCGERQGGGIALAADERKFFI